MTNLAAQIRAACLRAGLSQTQLARACGVSKTAVQHWESGMYVPGRDAAGTAGHLLGLDLGGTMKATRRCLCCDRAFPSDGPGNRLCSACTAGASEIAATEYAVVR